MEKNAPSRHITSNQQGLNEDLPKIVQKHMSAPYQKPICMHTLLAFDELAERLEQERISSVILDSGCGTGESTIFLAQKYPERMIIGIDKSEVRLQKIKSKEVPRNALFVRADQFDFWRLVSVSELDVTFHTMFYPNPWPKKTHAKRRIFGHPAFVLLPKLTKNIEMRSNWLIYLQEFAAAWELLTGDVCDIDEIVVDTPITLFEKKFHDSGHPLYRLKTVGKMT